MIEEIDRAIEKIKAFPSDRPIRIISHFDADGISSAAIFSRAIQREGKKFSLEIVKSLEEDYINSLEEDLIVFLDLASGSLNYLGRKRNDVIILDHHEIINEIPKNVLMVNPVVKGHEKMSAAAICYLFARRLSVRNKDLANLAVIGMVGDSHEKEIGKFFSEILEDSETVVKKGLLAYPSTRPVNKVLEYSSNPYIPGVSGSREGVTEVLREAGFKPENGQYKALYELDKDEMTRLVTAVALKMKKESDYDKLIGNIFLIKFFNKLEDAREISALINACSRMDNTDISLGFCLGNRFFREEAERIYVGYKQSLVSALKYFDEGEKYQGKDYVIFNAKDNIKDTIIGTVASIVSHSPIYNEGAILIALAYTGEKIKVSARIAGREGRNVREILNRAVVSVGGEVGGHPNAAGCLILREREQEFIDELRKVLDLEMLKV